MRSPLNVNSNGCLGIPWSPPARVRGLMLPLVTLKRNGTRYHHGGLREAAGQAALASLDAEQRMPSLRQVAAGCGVAHPALYRHFTNLEALRLAMAAACFRDFARHITAAVSHERDPYARLAAGTAASI